MSNALDCRFLETAAEIAAMRADWEALLKSTRSSDLLLSHHWYHTWRRVFGSRVRNGVVTVRRSGALIALMPIMIGRVLRSPSMAVRHDYMAGDEKFLAGRSRFRLIPIRQLSPILGLEASMWRGDPLVAPGEKDSSCDALLHFFRDFAGWDVAVFPLPESFVNSIEAACRMIGVRVRIDRLHRPMYRRADLPPWDAFLKAKGGHFRKRSGAVIKRANKEGLTFQTFAGPEDIGRGLAVVAEVAKRSWKASGREGQAVLVPYTPASQRFFEALCSDTDGGTVPVVSAIYQDGTPKAAFLSAAFGKRLVTLLTFYDPSIKHASPGHLLIKMAYEWAADRGMTEIDFNSNNPFSAVYADRHEVYHNLTLFNGSLYGRVLHALSQPSRHHSEIETSFPSAGASEP